MLAMRDEEVFFAFMFMLFGTGLAVLLIVAWIKGRNRKLKIIETALQHGSMDDATKHLLIQELTKPGLLVQVIQAAWNSGKLLGAVGWVGIFLGISLLLVDERDAFQAGIGIAFFSFAILTLPFALRELETRRRPNAPPAPRDAR